jgi:hypothetical protein
MLSMLKARGLKKSYQHFHRPNNNNKALKSKLSLFGDV